MKVAVATICYNEADFIGAVVRNWLGKVEKHVIFLSSKPWHGMELPKDETETIARKLGAEVISLPWPSETAQRNYACGYLHDYDYVLTVDADELYTESDQMKILESLGTNAGEFRVDNTNCYRVKNVRTYFKTTDFILDPPDTHWPSVAVNPKKATYADCRIPSQGYELVLDVTMHHLTYLRDDLRLYHKLHHYEHHEQVRQDWYEKVWKKWTPEMNHVRAVGREKSRAIPGSMPKELLDLLRCTDTA